MSVTRYVNGDPSIGQDLPDSQKCALTQQPWGYTPACPWRTIQGRRLAGEDRRRHPRGPAMGQAIAHLVLGRDTRVALDGTTHRGSPATFSVVSCAEDNP